MWILALLACRHPATAETDTDVVRGPELGADSVVVYVTPDTLGAVPAADLGWCERLNALLGEYGLDAACVDGGVPPSSWTAESHTRMLWPSHRDGKLRANFHPECGSPSVLESLAAANDARFVWAADNGVLGTGGTAEAECEEGPSWSEHADATYAFVGDMSESFAVANDQEQARPTAVAAQDLVDHLDDGGLVGFLNVFESGGHLPRCWTDPDTEACDALWNVIVEGGIAEADDDRKATWLDKDNSQPILRYLGNRTDIEDDLRGWTLRAIEESIGHMREQRLEAPLRTLLAGMDEADRLDDLVLVVVADHGENPCVARLSDGGLHCEHGGMLTEWTGIVPTLVSPASLAETWTERGFLGDRDQPWSTTNLAYALADSFALSAADDWPTMEPVGTASSWTCKGQGAGGNGDFGGSGVKVAGGASLRCYEDDCTALAWEMPTSPTYRPATVESLPDALAGVDPGWAVEACAE